MDRNAYHYWNLHRGQWSVMVRGKVIDRCPARALHGVEFRVRPAGHERVIREGRKNVHAFAVADLSMEIDHAYAPEGEGWVEVSYNPFRGATFYRKDTGEAVTSAAQAVLLEDKRVFARGVM